MHSIVHGKIETRANSQDGCLESKTRKALRPCTSRSTRDSGESQIERTPCLSNRHHSKLKQAPQLEPHLLDSRRRALLQTSTIETTRTYTNLKPIYRIHSILTSSPIPSNLGYSLDPLIEPFTSRYVSRSTLASSPGPNLDLHRLLARSSHRALHLLESKPQQSNLLEHAQLFKPRLLYTLKSIPTSLPTMLERKHALLDEEFAILIEGLLAHRPRRSSRS